MAERALSIADVTVLEADYVERGQPSLLAPRSALVERWRQGHRDRETALRLAFLDWYSCSEPDFLTGMPELIEGQDSFFDEASEHLLAAYQDDEVGFVFGWMMTRFPYCCGKAPESSWLARGKDLWSTYAVPAKRPAPSVFVGRGAYGHYFAHIAAAAPA